MATAATSERRSLLPLLLVVSVAAVTVPTFLARAQCVKQGGGQEGSSDWCYTEIARLAIVEGVLDGRTPYLEPCTSRPTPCDEYPPLTMYPMWLSAWVGGSPLGTYLAAAALLITAACLTTWFLWKLVGPRALYFAAAPTLLLYGPMNWDLLGVVAMTAALYWFLRGRRSLAAIAVGVGAAAKIMPGLACAPMAFSRTSNRRIRIDIRFVVLAAVTWLVLDVPFAITGFHGWSELYRYNAARPIDVDSLWSVACHAFTGSTPCSRASVVDPLSAVLFLIVVSVVWRLRVREAPSTAPWTMGFAVLTVFFLTNKVYSPQYDLFLLPWFALVIPDLRAFLAFQAADVAIFLTRFRGFFQPSLDLFHIAVLARAVVLLLCIYLYIRARVASEPAEDLRDNDAARDTSPAIPA